MQLALIERRLAATGTGLQRAAGEQGLAQPDPADHGTTEQVQVGRGIGQAQGGVGLDLALQCHGDALH
ncbi:hypothetical protein D9M70_638060 [compost metagenome]